MSDNRCIERGLLKSLHTAFESSITESKKLIEDIAPSVYEPDAQKSLQKLKKHIEQFEREENKVAILSKMRAGTFSLKSKACIPIDFLETLVCSYIPRFDQVGVHYFIYIDPNMPKTVTYDKKVIEHVLTHYLDNALAYSGTGTSVYVDIRAKHLDDKTVQLNFSVTDTGEGIKKERLKEIFSLEALKDQEGIGLASCFYLLKEIGSELKVSSEIGKGSRFSFTIEAQTNFEPYFHIVPELRIGIYIDDRTLFGYAKLLYQYIISIGVSVASIKDLNDQEAIKGCNCLIIAASFIDKRRLESLREKYPENLIIPAIAYKTEDAFFTAHDTLERYLPLPTAPTDLFKLLEAIESNLSNEVLKANREDQEAFENLAQAKPKKELKILVVEDNPINLKLVQVVLSRYDFKVDIAEDGQKAVDTCKKKQFDLVLMDIDMPVMDGITATQKIKEYEASEGLPFTPIVALTSHDLVGEREEIIASGLDEHMPKPLNIGRLELMLEHYLGYKYVGE